MDDIHENYGRWMAAVRGNVPAGVHEEIRTLFENVGVTGAVKVISSIKTALAIDWYNDKMLIDSVT